MNKQARQYIGLGCAILSYYLVHEGAHLMYALISNVFKQVNVMGLGVQIDVYAEKMTDFQLGLFCLVGSVATTIVGYLLVLISGKVRTMSSKVLKACLYYVTLAMLFIDPIYLGILFKWFGGGDMNGISLLIPEILAQGIYIGLFLLNAFIFWKIVLPNYKLAFSEEGIGK